MKKLLFIAFFTFLLSPFASIMGQQTAKWISATDPNVNDTSSWIAFRKDFQVTKVPKKALATIAVDSKYWLWINGELVVFEGGLKRGPNPNDTYFDEVDLSSFLKKGTNKIAILVWYFGKEGFSHKDSGTAGLLFHLQGKNVELVSDETWLSRAHPAYGKAGNPEPNFRLAESNIRFSAAFDILNWQTADISNTYGFKPSQELGLWGSYPWNNLIKRPIPQWKDFGIKTIEQLQIAENDSSYVYTAQLPYNMQMTPIISLSDEQGNNTVSITTDHTYAGGTNNLRAEYITKKGTQEYESFGWLNGQKIIVEAPKSVRVKNISYRETGYDTEPEGSFYCDNDFYTRFWKKALRTLYVNMRDTYFDCPERERAQWWGDVVVLMGQSFYTYSTSSHKLMKKAIHELADWQRSDSTLYSPVPAGNWDRELPAQMLASIGRYGFWNYYMNTGDKETIEYVYPGVKKYLDIWELDDTGLTLYRQGGWSWGDWGDNIDIRLILAGWHYLALEAASHMADLLGHDNEAFMYRKTMEKIKTGFNNCWNGYAYRHPQYQKQTDDRIQALAVISGIADESKYPQLLDLFKTQWHASPYMEKYVMEALFIMNQGEFALERTEKRFAPMINNPDYSTLFEGWGIGTEGYGGGTTNHAWSGGAVTVISQYLCGIEPLQAGYKVFKIEPDPVTFEDVSITIPTVSGEIKSAFKKEKERFLLTVEVPKNTIGIVHLPVLPYENIKINGKLSKEKETADYNHTSKKTLELSPGNYQIEYF